MPQYRIRRATAADAAVVVRHRVAMFQEMGELAPEQVSAVESASHARLVDELASGEYLGWLVESEHDVVAGAGVLLHCYYPTSANPRGRPTAYILNVYTEPEHRRQGLALRLVAEILDWCRANDMSRASLHTSAAGRPVYERMGFHCTNEMRLDIEARI
jgi:GNAT superfamily N-acetyltransferase